MRPELLHQPKARKYRRQDHAPSSTQDLLRPRHQPDSQSRMSVFLPVRELGKTKPISELLLGDSPKSPDRRSANALRQPTPLPRFPDPIARSSSAFRGCLAKPDRGQKQNPPRPALSDVAR